MEAYYGSDTLKAKLTDEEKNWVLAYVSTNAKTELK